MKRTKEDTKRALEFLRAYEPEVKNNNGLFIISEQWGTGLADYYRVMFAYTEPNTEQVKTAEFTWASAVVFGYSIKDKGGRNHLAISGGNFDKALEIATSLAKFFNVPMVRFQKH